MKDGRDLAMYFTLLAITTGIFIFAWILVNYVGVSTYIVER